MQANPTAGRSVIATVCLEPNHAQLIAECLFDDFGAAAGFDNMPPEITEREAFEAVEVACSTYRELLEQIAWGNPSKAVSLTTERERLEKYAARLLSGGGDAMTVANMDLEKQRNGFKVAAVGEEIARQLEASR